MIPLIKLRVKAARLNSDPQTLHRSCDVKLVHCVDDDGGSGEEEEQQEEEDVEEDTSEPPARSAH